MAQTRFSSSFAARTLLFLAGVSPLFVGAWVAPERGDNASGNCRFGVTAVGDVTRYDVQALGAGAYLDWGLTPRAEPPDGLEYVHVVRLRDASRRFVYDPRLPALTTRFEESLRRAVRAHPAAVWLIGNEPDTAFEQQDALTPGEYALAYGQVYRIIKGLDPQSRIGIGTIVQPTPLRLRWLNEFWAAYQQQYHTAPPSDFWSIHSFILREARGEWGTGIPPGLNAVSGELYSLEDTNDPAIFQERLLNFRRWMLAHGQRYKPLWITEYGSLLPHDDRLGFVTQPQSAARDYMLATFDTLLSAADPAAGYPYDGNRLVQRWFWYSLDDELWRFGGSLFDPATGEMTLIGQAFADYVAAAPRQPALSLQAPRTRPRVIDGQLLLQAVVSNSGTAPALARRTLTWYAGHPERGGQLLGQPVLLTGALPGCGSIELSATFVDVPAASSIEVYARLDSVELPEPLLVRIGSWTRISRPIPDSLKGD